MPVADVATKKIRHFCNIDGECHTHRNYYCSICGQCKNCHINQEEPMNKTGKTGNCKVCDFCAQSIRPVTEVRLIKGKTVLTCQKCMPGSLIESADVKSCGCKYDGETPTYCPEHDQYYCSNCTGNRNECPVCDLYDDACTQKACLPRCSRHSQNLVTCCEYHQVWYCGGCHQVCPRCQADAIAANVKDIVRLPAHFSADMNQDNYPLVFCQMHGWYCSQCDRDCPSCNNRMRWEVPTCGHKKHYCSRCGLGCQKCGKHHSLVDSIKEHIMECPVCSHKEYRYCERHKAYYCTSCDGKCMWCDGCYTKGNVMYHKCGHDLSYCIDHKKYFCLKCGQKCKMCVMSRKHRCGKSMSLCKVHDQSFCSSCSGNCESCKKEAEVVESKLKHHCGCSILYCANHQIYFCPACDYLCNCSINCGIAEKYSNKEDEARYDRLTEDLEGQWAEFQLWLKNKDVFLDSFKDFSENWQELTMFLTPKLAMCMYDVEAEETNEKLMAVNGCFKAICKIMGRFVEDEVELDDEIDAEVDDELELEMDRKYSNFSKHTDSNGSISYIYNPKPHHFNIVITNEGDDLSAGCKITKFQSIVVDKK